MKSQINLCVKALLLFTFLSIQLYVIAEDEKKERYNLAFNGITLELALKQVAEKAGLQLIYSSTKINLDQQINQEFINNTIDEILSYLLKNTGIKYNITKNQLILSKKGNQNVITVSGTITNAESGEFLIAANVYQPQTLKGTVSNYYGFYSLKLQKGKNTLVYSYVGYRSQKIEIDVFSDTIINMSLTPIIEMEKVIAKKYTKYY